MTKKIVLLLICVFCFPSVSSAYSISYNTQEMESVCGKGINGFELRGCYVYNGARIYIREGLTAETRQRVIYHEWAHHLARNMGPKDYERIFGEEYNPFQREILAILYADYKMGTMKSGLSSKDWIALWRLDHQPR